MRNNTERKAFTIVEIVIVIAVIAILSAVLIPSFSGIIQSATISADQQKLSALNSQVSFYLGTGKTIGSAADLEKAIDADGADLWDKMDPESAKWGYHYWYNTATQRIEFGRYEDVVATPATVSFGKMVVHADSPSVAEEVKPFEKDSPRMIGGFYFLDSVKKNSENVIAKFFFEIDQMTSANYEDVYDMIGEDMKRNDDNKKLAEALYDRMKSVVIFNTNGIFTNGTEAQNLVHPYIPQNKTDEKMTLGSANYTGLDLSQTGISSVVISENIEVGNTFADFEQLTDVVISGDVKESDLLGIFFSDSFSSTVTITITEMPDISYQIQDSALYNATSGGKVGDLECFNAVTDFDINVNINENDRVIKIGDQFYVALNQFRNEGIELNLSASNFKGEEGKGEIKNETISLWDANIGNVTDGKLTVDNQFEGGAIEITATAELGGKTLSKEITVNLVSVKSVYLNLAAKGSDAAGEKLDLTNQTAKKEFEFTYDNTSPMEYEFKNLTVTYSHPVLNDDEIRTLGLADVTYSVTTAQGGIFSIANNILSLNKEAIVTAGNESTKTFTVTACGFEKEFTVKVINKAECPLDLTFTNVADYLHRLGNGNAVTLASLFKLKDGYTVTAGTVKVTVRNVLSESEGEYELMASGSVDEYGFGVTVVENADWTKTTLAFTGTGIAVIEVEADGVRAKKLMVEIVDGKNVTAYGELTSGNCILLSDIKISSGGKHTFENATLYGNGFTFDIRGGNHTGNNYLSNNYVILLRNSVLDNVKIIGDAYDSYSGKAENANNIPAVYATGAFSAIYNSYISNCASPVRANNGTLLIENTTLEGGSFANLDIRASQVTLRDVTTINQVSDPANPPVSLGLGIVMYYENVDAATTLTVEGTLTQYNTVSKAQVDQYIKNDYAREMINKAFVDDAFKEFRYSDGTTTWLNTGIISMNTMVGKNNVNSGSVPAGYGYTSMTAKVLTESVTGSVWTVITDANNYRNTPDGEWKPTEQNPAVPSYTFDYTDKNYQAKENGSNDFCYYDSENNKVLISMDEGDTKLWNTDILTVNKMGDSLTGIKVTLNGVDYTGKSISFSENGTYTVVYEYTDTYHYVASGSEAVEQVEVTYTKEVVIEVTVVKAAAKNATFDFNGMGYKQVTIGNDIYIMPDVSATSTTVGSTVIDGKTVYCPIVQCVTSNGKTSQTNGTTWYMYFNVFKNVITITDYADGGMGEAIVYGASTTTLPAGLTVSDPAGTFKYKSASNAPTTPKAANGILVYTSPAMEGVDRDALTVTANYTYKDNAGQTYRYIVQYSCPEITKNAGCVAPDTLVTLADGTKKEIQYVTDEDLLLVWNHFEGKYDTVPAAIIFNHGYDNNTVIKLNFSDGTAVKVINLHQFLDADLKQYVSVNAETVAQYIGHHFVKRDGDGYKTVTLESYEISEEYIEAYGVISSLHYNLLVEDLFSTDFMEEDYDLFNYFVIGEGMIFDAQQMQEDIEKYGLYTYEDFADYLTYEQFVAFNVQYFKIAVGKGLYTYDGILNLIGEYLNQ